MAAMQLQPLVDALHDMVLGQRLKEIRILLRPNAATQIPDLYKSARPRYEKAVRGAPNGIPRNSSKDLLFYNSCGYRSNSTHPGTPS